MNFIHQDTETEEESVVTYEEEEIEAVLCLECSQPIGEEKFKCKYMYNPGMGIIYGCFITHKRCVKKQKK